jgi:phosphoribosylanthranilate isomerase
MSVEVKICGINDAASFDACIEGGADFIGFVFARVSPRYVTPAEAASLSSRHRRGPLRVGLFLLPPDEDFSGVEAALDALPLDILQIYGEESRIGELRARFSDCQIWLSRAVTSREDLPLTDFGADRLLIEPRPASDDTRPGGLGRALPWQMLRGWQPSFPWILAGGLTPKNVARAIAESGAAAVDVSSGVESDTGVKDPNKIKIFISAAKMV